MTLDQIRAMLSRVNEARAQIGAMPLHLVNSVTPPGLLFMEIQQDGSYKPTHADPSNRKEAGFFLHGELNALVARLYAQGDAQ